MNGFSLEIAGGFGKLEPIGEDDLAAWINLLYFAKPFGKGVKKLQYGYRLKRLDNFLNSLFLNNIGICSRFRALLSQVNT